MEYGDPLQERYGTDQMREIWSDSHKYSTWHRLWVSLAEAQSYAQMIDIPKSTIRKMRDETFKFNEGKIREYEAQTGHDVYSAILDFRDQCGPEHGKYIHLGATSQFVVDNTDCIRVKESMDIIADKTKILINHMCRRADNLKDKECLAYTHGQRAQITTIGRRIAMWAEPIKMCLDHMSEVVDQMKWRGAKGAVGNQTGYCYIDPDKVSVMEEYLSERFGFSTFHCTGQTYHRSQDVLLCSSLVSLAAATHKMAQDIRLLCSMKEMSEKKVEVGSSAMPYKSNPIMSEKICSLSKMVSAMMSVFVDTASNQWLERSLDDSANRRIALPKMFLMMDEIIDCCTRLIDGCTFFDRPDKVGEHLPYAVMEWAVTKAVQNGHDRADMHEKMRNLAESSLSGDQLINRVLGIPELDGVDARNARCWRSHIGNSVKQVEEFVHSIGWLKPQAVVS